MNLVFATHNLNKLKELQALVPATIQLKSLDDINCTEEIVEDAETIEGNARIKARHLYENYTASGFGDDTGLEVEALNGAPGVYSARYAGPDKNDKENIMKLLEELKSKPNRKARFKTVIALILEGKSYEFTGICEGIITEIPRGNAGFGYDPVFQPEGYEQTFAEMPLALKNKISHRALAVQQLIQFLNNR